MSNTVRSDTLRQDLRLRDAKDRRLDTDIPTVASTDLGLCPRTAGMQFMLYILLVRLIQRTFVIVHAALLTIFLMGKNFHSDQVPRRT